MRRSLGGSYGGGGGGNGGDMLRTVRRAMRTRLNNFQESLPSDYSPSPTSKSSSSSTTKTTSPTKPKTSKSKHALSLSSSTPSNGGSNGGLPLPSSASNWPSTIDFFEHVVNDDDGEKSEIDSEWECLENYYDPIFGVVPSTHEVQHALLSLHQVFQPEFTSKEQPNDVEKEMDGDQTTSATDTMQRASSKGSDSDWMEPSMQPYDWKLAQSPGWGRVYDAFHLLETEPSVQRMVVSLSSDQAVWNAVLNNEAVREIRDSYRNAAESLPPSSNTKPDFSKTNLSILQWIFNNMKAKLLEVLGNISQFVADIFKPLDHDKEEQSFAFTEKLKSSFLLTVVVLLIVVVARGHKA